MSESSSSSFSEVTRIHILLLQASGLLAINHHNLNFPISQLLSFCSHVSESLFSLSYVSSIVRDARESKYNVERIAETVGHCGGHSRFIILFLNRAKIAKIVRGCEELWHGLESQEKAIITRFVGKSTRLVRYYGGACGVMCLLYVMTSQAAPLFEDRMANETTYRSLPYAFVVNVQATPWYELTVALQTVLILYACTITTGTDTTAPFFVMVACGHIKSLCLSLDRISRYEVGKEEPVVYRELVHCIRYHQKIIQLCQQIDSLMSLVFLSGLMSTTYNMSLIGLKLIGDDPEKLKYLTVLTILMIQLLICQWAPDALLNQSKTLANHAYFVPHYGYRDKNLGKLLHIVLFRCQIPFQLRAGGYIKLSMECFGSMVTSAMSFFTVISSFSER